MAYENGLAEDPLHPTVELIDLASHQCKWPYEGLMSCGRLREGSGPYCPEHEIRAGRGAQGLRNPAVYDKSPRAKPRAQVTLLIEEIG